MDLEKLREALKELSPEDREFILEYFEGGRISFWIGCQKNMD